MSASCLQVQTCCCFTLRTGAKAFGFITVVGCLLDVLAFWLVFYFEMDSKTGRFQTPLTLALQIVTQGILILASVFLILGIYQEKVKYMSPYLVSVVLVVMYQAGLMFLPPLFGDYTVQRPDLIAFVVYTLLYTYGWMVVYSHYLTVIPGRSGVA